MNFERETDNKRQLPKNTKDQGTVNDLDKDLARELGKHVQHPK